MESYRSAAGSRRAAIIGALMAIIVFGGALVYLFDTRPRSYRAEGGDVWHLARYEPAPGHGDELEKQLTAKVRTLDDAEGFWGMEVLRGDKGSLAVLTRWRSEADYQRMLSSPKAAALSPDPALTQGPPALESWSVEARE
jgi:quinol monooxygenase YgiN